MSVPVSVYVHVPFCLSRCAYCDFHSSAGEVDATDLGDVIWAVASAVGEGATRGRAFAAAVPFFLEEFVRDGVLGDVPSLYVGGGTPTVLGSSLVSMVRDLVGMLPLTAGAEVTVEANPDTVDRDLIAELRDAGVTRVSLGVQSFDDDVLATLGRCHTAERATQAATVLAASGLDFSLDLMCGVPGQSLESWTATLTAAIARSPHHVSVYPLALEEGTPLTRAVECGDIPEPDPDLAAAMMIAASDALHAAGYARYEVASYARPGHECRHNIGYWSGTPYLGVGPSAASMLPVPLAQKTPLNHYVRTWPEDWRVRFVWNLTTDSFLGYLWDRQPEELEALSGEDARREDLMLGLRRTAGVSDVDIDRSGLGEVFSALADDGLVERRQPGGDGWRLSRRGWLLGNEAFGRVWNR